MTAIQDSDDPYGIAPEYIERGRRLIEARNQNAWEIGRLTLEAVPHYQAGRHDDGALEYFADEIGWLDLDKTVATLAEYRSAAAEWSEPEVAKWPGLTVGAARRLNRFG